MILMPLTILIHAILLALFSTVSASDYHERLLLRPLPGNLLLASFNFRSNTSAQSFEEQNFRYFPRSLGQILQHAATKELHLRFSVGRWDAESWGARPWDGAREGGTGVELWAWVEADTDEDANARWLTLTNALSGLFCASLNFIDSTRTIRPVSIFEPEGIHPKSSLSKLQLLHGTLPHEVVCTENLTPFLKLLPCKGKAGISSLLDGHKLFDATWQTMAIDIRPVCDANDSNCVLEMEQSVDMVLDLERSKRPRDNPIPRPIPIEQIECDTSKSYNSDDSCYPLEKKSEPAWNVAEVFGRHIKGHCPLTAKESQSSATVCLNVPSERKIDVYMDPPSSDFEVQRNADTHLTCYRPPPNGTDFSISLPEQDMTTSIPQISPRLHAFRSITGYGQERGGIQSVLVNPSSTESLDVIYLDSLPWYMKPYLHTLRSDIFPPSNVTAIKETHYRPMVDRHRGTHLELQLTIPPSSSLTLTYDFEKAILRYTEYPPDANRGFDVAPAIIRLLPSAAHPDTNNRRGVYVRTTSLLLPLPTPDFSMPYNVIILTSTVMALGFGSIFNIVVRRFVAADELSNAPFGLLVAAVVQRAQGRFRRLVARFGGGREKTE